MQIRPATLADIPAVLPLVAAICALHEAWDPERFGFVPNPAERYERWLASLLNPDRGLLLVVTHPAATPDVVGFLSATIESAVPIYRLSTYAYIHDVWVEPAYRGGGAGRQLLQQALQTLTAQGITQVRLETAASNDAARRLFQSCGFRVSTLELLATLPSIAP